jgi:predicted signal transduction protein with EAL and GGDEF domain
MTAAFLSHSFPQGPLDSYFCRARMDLARAALSCLKQFDVDYLKIDKSFVGNLESDSKDRALVQAIIVMAHKLGLKVIAEGVETVSQLRLCPRLSVCQADAAGRVRNPARDAGFAVNPAHCRLPATL